MFRCMLQFQPSQREVKNFWPVGSQESAVTVMTGVRAWNAYRGKGEFSENRTDPLWGLPSLLFSGYVGFRG